MAYTAKELKHKTEPELAAIAEELGLLLNADVVGKNGFITEILQAQEEDLEGSETVIEGELMDAAVDVEPPPTKKKARRVKIIVSNQDGPEQTRFVKVQVNGEMFTLPREIEVTVPEYVVEVLNNAVITRIVQEDGEWVERKARRFPYHITGYVK